jgi:hypothetical protein
MGVPLCKSGAATPWKFLINYRGIKDWYRYKSLSVKIGYTNVFAFFFLFSIFSNLHSMARNLGWLFLEFTPRMDCVPRVFHNAKIWGSLFLVWLHTKYHQEAQGPCVHSMEAFGLSCHTYIMAHGLCPVLENQISKTHHMTTISASSEVGHKEGLSPRALTCHSHSCFLVSLLAS